MKVTDTIYQVDDIVGNPTVIVGDGELSLVDTGTPGCEGKIFALIESLGYQPSDVKNILLTHSDGDHIGSLPAIVQTTGGRVYAQRDEAEVIEGKRKSRGGGMVSTPVHVDQIVKEGDVLPLHGGIRVVETFGHTSGHVCYYLVAQDILIAGDCLNNSNGLSGSPPQYTAEPDKAAQAVKKLADLGPNAIAFGHGPAITSGAASKLRALADKS